MPEPLRVPAVVLDDMVAHAVRGLPLEACGLVLGPSGGAEVVAFKPCRNAAESSRVYILDPREHLRIEREADDAGLEVVGVVHSHTHTEAYPSPTDIAQAPDPSWHYLIVSLKREVPSTRSYRIVDGIVDEEPIQRT